MQARNECPHQGYLNVDAANRQGMCFRVPPYCTTSYVAIPMGDFDNSITGAPELTTGKISPKMLPLAGIASVTRIKCNHSFVCLRR